MDASRERARASQVIEAAGNGGEVETPEGRSGPELIRKAAEGTKLTAEEQADALDWFLSAEEGEFTKAIRLNVGGPVDEDGAAVSADHPPRWVEWVVRPLDLDTIKRVRRQASGVSRRQRRQAAQTGEFDDTLFNLGIVVEATVSPDLLEAARRMGIADPRQAVKLRFQHKSGLVGQIVGEVLDLSGYNENDVRDASEVAAAGESSG
jgi:hypothetical protein